MTKTIIICHNCQKEFEIYPYRLDVAKYCSRDCHYNAIKGVKVVSHLSENGRENISNARRVHYIEKHKLEKLYWKDNLSTGDIAEILKTSSGVIKYWLKKYNIIRKTLSQARTGKFIGKDNPKWRRTKKRCLQCGSIYEVPPSLNHIQYCSKECWYQHGYNDNSKNKMSESQTRILQNPQKREEYLHRILDHCHYNIRPNKPEQVLDDMLQKEYPNKWRYTGDFSVVIGNKSPDWTNCNGKKAVILLHGDYWHLWKAQKNNPNLTREQVEAKDIEHYKKFGFECLIIWEHELKYKNVVKQRIKEFAGV
jgi:G:T-mismatch repair DNA endonuclease (very short patch repair protein)